MAEIIVFLGILGNLILCLLLVWRGWSGRLQLFTIMTGLAVLVDVVFNYIHGFAHSLYGPARIFMIYWLFPIFEGLCAWEAFRVGLTWLENLLLIQVGLAVVALAAHLHGDLLTIYRIEIFNCYFDIFGVTYCILRLKGEPTYARP